MPTITKSIIQPICLILFALSLHGLSYAEARQWIILPDTVHPYSAPLQDSPRQTDTVLRHGQTVDGHIEASPTGEQWVRFTRSGRNLYLPLALVVRRTVHDSDAPLPIGTEKVDRHHPLPLDYRPSDLVPIPAKWNYHADTQLYLRREAAGQLERLLREAEKEGIKLRIASAFRSAAAQRYIYNRKIQSDGIAQNVVAKPGHSEHQLGTAVDFSGLDPQTSLRISFADTPEGQWLAENAHRFGFRMSYPQGMTDETGYTWEPWHFRYIGKPRH